jgi:hypothetical protein
VAGHRGGSRIPAQARRQQTGRYFDVQQEAAALAQAYDADARQRLREVSEQLTALVSSH